jgi:Iron-sulfur cluster assembly accessory protein
MDIQTVTLTESAARRIAEIAAGEPSTPLLRSRRRRRRLLGLSVQVRPCGPAEPDDTILERAGATVLIDPVSLQYLAGSEIDFVDDLIGAAFKINNPNATSSCGCGTSFAV